jgi:endonuclease YncB( thermonuclease family)
MAPALDLIDNYIRRAEFVNILDGDTMRLRVDCGYETFRLVRIRVDGIDTAELHGTSNPARGQHAREVCERIMQQARVIWVQTHRKETYADEEQRTFERYVGTVVVDGHSLPDLLKAQLTQEDGKWGESPA